MIIFIILQHNTLNQGNQTLNISDLSYKKYTFDARVLNQDSEGITLDFSINFDITYQRNKIKLFKINCGVGNFIVLQMLSIIYF